MVMPRTIDKLRAFLPGGNPGEYFINSKITGLSGFMLKRLGIHEDALFAVVASAQTDNDVAAWLRERTDVSQYEALNTMLRNAQPHHAEDEAYFRTLYAQTLAEHPELDKIVDILDADDRRMFAGRQ